MTNFKQTVTSLSFLFAFGVTPILSNFAYASDEEMLKRFDNLSIEELINIPINVASLTSSTTRLSPGIITVITHDEIANSGAKDLMDILRFVPGIELAADGIGVVSLASRGIWLQEGRVLMLWDDMQINENMYGNLALGNRFPIQDIEKIEVIRGPGSVKYGDTAGLAVIKITTRQGKDIKGLAVHGLVGQSAQDLSAAIGGRKDDFDYKMIGLYGHGQRSDQNYTDANGTTFSMKGNSDLNPSFIDLGLKKSDFTLGAIYEHYQMTDRTAFSTSLPVATTQDFDMVNVLASYKYKIKPNWSITPEFKWKQEEPWKETNAAAVGFVYYKRQVTRTVGGVKSDIEISHDLNANLGMEYREDDAVESDGIPFIPNNSMNISLKSWSYFGELEYIKDWGAMNLGLRYEQDTGVTSSLVPRFTFVKKLSADVVGKLLYSESFRAPLIENLDFAGSPLKPELISTYEIEVSDKISDTTFLSANIFKIDIHDPIVFVTNNAANFFANFNQLSTEGIELEAKNKVKTNFLSVNYSFYRAVKSDVSFYGTSNSSENLGLPQHKLTIQDRYELSNTISFNPNLVLLSNTHTYAYDSAAGQTDEQGVPPSILLGAYIQKDKLLCNGCSGGIGVANLLNQSITYVQPYNSHDPAFAGHSPLPDYGRDFFVKFNYATNF